VPVITQIADAVVQELNGHEFSQPLEAKRYYRPLFDLAAMADLHVSVVPKAASAERLDRSRHQEEYQVDVAVQKKVEALDNTALDPLAGLVEEIGLFLRDRRLGACPAAVWLRTENVPIYAPEHLDELRQFTSVLTLTYRLVR
jgi:hypothetical protein